MNDIIPLPGEAAPLAHTQAQIDAEIVAISAKMKGSIDIYDRSFLHGARAALRDTISDGFAKTSLAYDEGVQYALAWREGLKTAPPSEEVEVE